MNDIKSANDIDQLVEHFYKRVLPDPIIGFLFTQVASINLDTHLPKISLFWQRQLLGTQDYRGRVFEVHQHIHKQAELTEHHFHRWLYLFKQSVDSLFQGDRADLAKNRATAIAQSMLKGLQDRHMQDILLSREQKGVFIFNPENS